MLFPFRRFLRKPNVAEASDEFGEKDFALVIHVKLVEDYISEKLLVNLAVIMFCSHMFLYGHFDRRTFLCGNSTVMQHP